MTLWTVLFNATGAVIVACVLGLVLGITTLQGGCLAAGLYWMTVKA